MFPKMEADVNSKQDVYVNIDTHTHTQPQLCGDLVQAPKFL